MDKKKIGEAIKKYRKQSKITQKQLATMIDKSESTVQKYESGEVEAPLSVLEQICSCLGLDISELLESDPHFDFMEYFGRADRPLMDYFKILGYEFKDHPVAPDNYQCLVHYGYSYDIPINDWVTLVDSINADVHRKFNELMNQYASTRKLIK